MSVTYGLNANYTDIYDVKFLSKNLRQQKTTTKDQNSNKTNTKTKQQKTEKREGEYYLTGFISQTFWIDSFEFYFTYFILHDSPKSQLTLEFSGLAYLLLNAVHLLVSYKCTLLPALFTPVAAPVPNHSHHVCARAVWSVYSLVAWASLCLGSPPLHGGNVPSVGKFFLYLFKINLFKIVLFSLIRG